MPQNKRKYIESHQCYGLLGVIQSATSSLTSLVQDESVPKKQKKEAEKQKKLILRSIGKIKKSFYNMTGSGDNEYAVSRVENEIEQLLSQDLSTLTWGESVVLAGGVGATPISPSPLPKPSRHLRPRKEKKELSKKELMQLSKQNIRTPERDPPTNGVEYRPASAVKHIVSYDKDNSGNNVVNKLQGRIIYSMKRKKQIPVSKRQMERLAQKHRQGKEVALSWNQTGRPPSAKVARVLDFLKDKGTLLGRNVTLNRWDIRESMRLLSKKGKNVSRASVNRMTRVIKGLIPGTRSVRHKNTTRVDAEKSVKNCCSLLHTIANTHFRINDTPGAMDDKRYAQSDEGAKELYKMVSSFHDDAPLIAVHTSRLGSMDDSTLFACQIPVNKDDEWCYLIEDASDTAQKASGTRSYFRSRPGASKGGFRTGLMIRMTWTITADGTIFPLFASILHLTERELLTNLCPSGILILQFPGMCVGSAVDSRIRQIGYVAFVRQGVDESLVFREYIKLVFIPQVKLIRQLSGFIHGDDANAELPKEAFWVQWLDGGIPQLKNIKSDEMVALFKCLDIIINKHAAATSAVAQPCDLASLFRSLRALMGTMLESEDADLYNDSLRLSFASILSHAKATYRLDMGSRQTVLLAFLVCLPEAVTRALRDRKILLNGFERAGMIDSKSKGLPSFTKIVDTMSIPITEPDSKKMRTSFNQLQSIHQHTGEVTMDALKEVFGAAADDSLRSSVAEHMQRCKTMNNAYQIEKRTASKAAVLVEKHRANVNQLQRNADHLKSNAECEESILKAFQKDQIPGIEGNPAPLESASALCTLSNFASPTARQLRSFIVARVVEDVPLRITCNLVPTGKKSFAQEKAFQLRNIDVKLRKENDQVVARIEQNANTNNQDANSLGNSTNTLEAIFLFQWRSLSCTLTIDHGGKMFPKLSKVFDEWKVKNP